MVDEQQPAKKVVKRVVKKTVVRPTSSTPPPTKMRYGRPVATAAASKPKAKAESKAGASPRPPPVRAPARPRVDVGAKVGAAGRVLGSRGSSAASGVAGAAGSASRATATFVVDRWHAVIDWRIPHIDLRIAAVITGLIVGLVTVGLGLASLALFTQVRGVASGGGRLGSLAFVVVAFVGYYLGARLLSAFGSTQGRLTSGLAIVLAIVAMLGLFLGIVDSPVALVVLPVLSLVAYSVAYQLIVLAENSPPLED
ncbi:hypothetical protein [Aeromicrobium sp.]|uniref:hypothetical protein n=1 Tax=Aeromicrobium sp. TaxID=1871063 RepID=UPI0019BF2BFA|nr:hypothetical protein [Aeromicrobium sp.]MBC7633961.1 hypothetical protein [Aeromicrobium sp.]